MDGGRRGDPEKEDAPHTCMTIKTLLHTDGSCLIRLLL